MYNDKTLLSTKQHDVTPKNNNGATLNELRRIAMFNLKNFLY